MYFGLLSASGAMRQRHVRLLGHCSRSDIYEELIQDGLRNHGLPGPPSAAEQDAGYENAMELALAMEATSKNA